MPREMLTCLIVPIVFSAKKAESKRLKGGTGKHQGANCFSIISRKLTFCLTFSDPKQQQQQHKKKRENSANGSSANKKKQKSDEEVSEKKCHHSILTEFKEECCVKYFKEDWYKTNPTAPRQCASCNVKFGTEEYQVKKYHGVFACNNALFTHHSCTFAYCCDCYEKKQAEYYKNLPAGTTGRRASRSRK